jgi:hypothetical protein
MLLLHSLKSVTSQHVSYTNNSELVFGLIFTENTTKLIHAYLIVVFMIT